METATEILNKYKGDLIEAIEFVVEQYRKSRKRGDRNFYRSIYEELVRMDKIRYGWRRYVKL